MGTDTTVAFQDSLPESGQWNFASWKLSVVTECSMPTAVARHFPRPTAGLRVEQSRKDHSWAAPQSFKPLRLDWLRGRFVSRTVFASVRRSLDDYRLGSGLQGCL